MRNPTYEQALTKQGVEWEYLEKVALSDISVAKGLRNQARLQQPLDEELVENYTAAYRAQDKFPPLVLHKPGRGAYVPIDGNQRIAAATRAGYKGHDAYLVRCDDPRIVDRLTWVFNNLVNGKRLSREECLEHAVSYVRKYSIPQKEAAKEWGIPLSTINARIRALEVVDILGRHDLPPLDDMRAIAIAPLQGAGEDVLAAAAATVSSGGLTIADTQELADAIRTAPTHERKLQTIKEYASSEKYTRRKAESRGGRVKLSSAPRDQLVKLIREVNSLFDKHERAALKPAGGEYRRARDAAADCAEHLCLLFGLGDYRRAGEAAS